MKTDKHDWRAERRPYQKPRVERVELIAEEQVLGGCKAVEGQPGIEMVEPYGSCFLWGCVANAS